jgi:YVTN family beta-propeller protein
MAVLTSSCVAISAATFSVSQNTSAAIHSVAIESTPLNLAVDPVTDMLYTANTLSHSVSVVSLSTGRVTANVALSTDPLALAVDPTTDTVYVDGSKSVIAINGATDKVTHTIALPSSGGAGITVDPTTDTVYLTGAGGVSIVALAYGRSTSKSTNYLLWVGLVIVVGGGGAAALLTVSKRRRAEPST